jgi:tetratricopeptide (TPR) repeat protein
MLRTWRIAILVVAGLMLSASVAAAGEFQLAEYVERRAAYYEAAPEAETDPDKLYAAAYRAARIGEREAAAALYAQAFAGFIVARRAGDPETAVALLELAELYSLLELHDLAAMAQGLSQIYPFHGYAATSNVMRYVVAPPEDAEDATPELQEALRQVRDESLAEFWLPGAVPLEQAEPGLLAEFFISAGDLLLAHGLPEDALAVLEIGIEQTRSGGAPLGPTAFECPPADLPADWDWARSDALLILSQRLGELATSFHGEADAGLAGLMIDLAQLYQRRGDMENAMFGLEGALDLLRTQAAPSNAAGARAHYRLGCIHRYYLYDEESLPHFQAALELSRSAFPAEHPERLASLAWNGIVQAERGDGEAAIELLAATLAALQGGALDDETTLQALDVVTQGLDMAGIYALRDEIAALRFDLLARRLDSDDPAIIPEIERLAWEQQNNGRFAEAIELYERLISMTEEAASPDGSYDRLAWLRELADLYREVGDAGGEAGALERRLALFTLLNGEDELSYERADLLVRLAAVYDGLGRGAEAGVLYREGLAVFEAAGYTHEPGLAFAMRDYGHHLLSRGDADAAREIFDLLIERWSDIPDMEELVAASRAGLAEIAAREEAGAARLLLARAQRHDALLNDVARLEADYARDSGDTAILGALIEAYSALLTYEQATDFGSNLFVLASRRLARYAARADPDDAAAAAFIARTNANLYMILRAFPDANRWLAAAGTHAEAEMLRGMLAALDQRRFTPVEEYALGPFVVSAVETAGTPPNASLLWPLLDFTAKPFTDAPPHRTIAFVLVRQGEADAPRYYLYLHSLNRARLIALFGTERPAYEAVKARIAASLNGALTLAQTGSAP